MATDKRSYGAMKLPEDPEKCIVPVFEAWGNHQCSRNRGQGPGGMYCTQHANRLAKRAVDKVRWAKESKDRLALGRLLGHEERLQYVIKEQAKELYNAAFPRGTQKGYPAPPDSEKWIAEHIALYIAESKKVRKKP